MDVLPGDSLNDLRSLAGHVPRHGGYAAGMPPITWRHSHGSSIQKIMELGLAVENESSLSDAETEI